MQGSFTPPKALSDFMHSLSTPAPAAPPAPPLPPEAWPELSTPDAGQHLPPLFPLSPAWLAARDAFIGHVMACRVCVTHSQKRPRLCPEGARLHDSYNATPYTASATSTLQPR